MKKFKLLQVNQDENQHDYCYFFEQKCLNQEIYNLTFEQSGYSYSWYLCVDHLKELKEFLNNGFQSPNFRLDKLASSMCSCRICNNPAAFKLFFIQDNTVNAWYFCKEHLDELKEFLNNNI